MREELLQYYQRELVYLRESTRHFAQRHPKIAQRLTLEENECGDPHVERMIEAFAFLAARIHLKIDDEFPEISESLIDVLYPHFLAPVPSMSVVQFTLDPEQGNISSGYEIPRHSPLKSKELLLDTPCMFRTAYPLTLWPIEVTSAELETSPSDAAPGAKAVLRLVLETQADASFAELRIDSLRFFLHGPQQLPYELYEAILRNCFRVDLSTGEAPPLTLPSDSLRPVGFEEDEGLLPYTHRSFLGYRLLQEYFNCPRKFLFFELRGLHALRERNAQTKSELLFHLDQIPQLIEHPKARHFRLGCSPVVNLFKPSAPPVHLSHAKTEYHIKSNVARPLAYEVYSVDRVRSFNPNSGDEIEYLPFYSFKHSMNEKAQRAFWQASRRQSERKGDRGTEVYLTLVDLDFRPTLPRQTDSLHVDITACNRDLPEQLRFGDKAEGDLELQGGGPVRTVRFLNKPSKTVRPPLRHAVQWRLISHLSLNYLSLVGGSSQGSDPEALREILTLYNFEDRPEIRHMIQSLTGIQGRQIVRRISTGFGIGPARGIETELTFDEGRLAGSGVFLYASVLERFLGLYVSINSFSRMVASSRQRGVLKQWPPRAGDQILL